MTSDEITNKLAAFFEPSEVHWKAQVVRGNRALAVAYIDARCVEDRLDEVLGVGGWQDAYEVLAGGGVVCTLRVRVGDDWLSKSDVGSPSDQPDEGDRLKAAFSDALKRAAVKLGVGRYLYRLPQQWVDYDPQTRQLKAAPKLPAWAMPGAKESAAAGAPASITSAQWGRIKAELAQRGVKQREFLERLGCTRPGEIPAPRFGEALRLAQSAPVRHPEETAGAA